MECINIDGLVVYANHGVLNEEKKLGQKFIVSAKIYADLSIAMQSDNVDDTVNYAEVCRYITNIMTNNTYNLIEALASCLANKILEKYDRIDEIEITLQKPFAPVGLPLDMVSVTVSKKRYTAYLGIGSNMGDRKQNIDSAIRMLNEDKFTKVTKIAKYIETKPYGYVEQDDFINTAVEVKTLRNPEKLLELANSIEKDLGRVRDIHWGPRTIDIDILLFEENVCNTDTLVIPHKEMHLREFVLQPLCEIVPSVKHPLINKTIYQIYADLLKQN